MLSTILTKSFSKDTALLILRVITGTVLIHHGYEKLANIENFDFITEFKNIHNKKIFNLVRDEDLFAWKFAKKGFFKFKENIPRINQRIIENY